MMNDFSSQQQKKNGRGCHPHSIAAGTANLVLYKPGQSGNPGGRRKGVPSIVHAIERIIALGPDELKAFEPANQAEAIALQRIKDAASTLNPATASAQIKATEMILNRVDGPVEKRLTIEQVPELKTRIGTMVAALRAVNANIHAKHCEPSKCVCLDEEQFRAAILSPYPEPMRALVEAEIALSD